MAWVEASISSFFLIYHLCQIFRVETESKDFVSVRAKSQYNRIELCRYRSCEYQGRCHFAHNALELSYWKS